MEQPPGDQPPPSEDVPPVDIYALALVIEGGLAVVAGAIGWWVGVPPLETVVRRGQTWREPLQAIAWGLAATVPMAVGLLLIDRYPIGRLGELHRVVKEYVAPLFANLTPAQLAIISLTAGVGEEMLFRGLLQAGVAEWIGPPGDVWFGLVAASLVFGLCHYVTTTYFAVTAFIGLYLGALFLWTDNLLAPIVAHAAYDFLALLYLTPWKGRKARQSD